MANNFRKSIDLLPAFFRTEKNDKFLSSTLDQFISPPKLTRIDAFIGSKDTPTYRDGDQYLIEKSPLREQYQLEPALVVRTLSKEIKKAFAFDDLLNQINNQGGTSSNVDRVLNPKFYSYDPKIDWDKFINFREYYWLPVGPDAISITGTQQNSVTEFNVTDADDEIQFVFSGLTTTQELILYRGATYVFNINSKHSFYIKYTSDVGPDNQYTNTVTGNGVSNGQIIFTVDWQTPNNLFYVSDDEQLSTGRIVIREANENTYINVDDEIIGKKNFFSSNGIKFINGLKVNFGGTVFPEYYRNTDFIVEGVGNAIRLIRFSDLDTPDVVADLYNTRFDGTNFDQFPFDNFKNIPLIPEYVTINKSSKDLNPWSRYNRWFHSDVIKAVAEFNNAIPVFPAEYRASRPIIEFVADLQLYNFGNAASPNVDVIDTFTTNAFAIIEKENGYYVDGILLEAGYRVIFNADTDPLVRGKIFKVDFIQVNGNLKLDLIPDTDILTEGVAVLVKQGVLFGGSSWFFVNGNWVEGQSRTTRNQAPLFDLFDDNGNSYSSTYYTSTFKGNKLFGYGVGSGVNDPILGFPLLYRNVGVEGTYLFKNYFATDEILVVGQQTTIISTAQTYFKINSDTPALITVWTDSAPYNILSRNGIYETPLNLTNNPLNQNVTEFTLTELSDHVESMINRDPEFFGEYPGISNIKDLPFIAKYGTKLIANINPLSFAHHFISDQEHSVVDAMRAVGEHYLQFKINLIKTLTTLSQDLTPIEALDNALTILNQNKTTTFPYYSSDMVPYGTGPAIRSYRVTDSRNTKYALPTSVSFKTLNSKGLLVYLNNVQLINGKEYQFDSYDSNVELLVPLVRGDVILVKDYPSTDGNFVPPTPTKLGIYPKFEPEIFYDDTYATGAVKVIQGHDGSITVAFNDYRDDILLEFEKRVYNNIKVSYNRDAFDINEILPGVYRPQEYAYSEIFSPVYKDFLKWKTTYGVEVEKNLFFDVNNHKTYNYSGIVTESGTTVLPGNWRAIFKLYFDTDRPHTHPWEMLGFSVKPVWWEDEYGPAPYTSGNTILWRDLEDGNIVRGELAGVYKKYSRPGLSNIIPVDSSGKLVDIRNWGVIGTESSLDSVQNDWKYGDMGPAEASWRRSSYWPYAIQIISALTKPALYTSLMFDVSRLTKNKVGQYVYSEDMLFLNPARMLLPYETVNGNKILTAGYSVCLVEIGIIRNSGYISQLKSELQNSEFNLMAKVGGFVSKDKLEVVIDSVNPNSINPGILLPVEDYSIHFNVSAPVNTIAISGVILQKSGSSFIVRGYDKINSYFEILPPINQRSDEYITVGGTSEDYLIWSINTYYPIGQIIVYQNKFYRVISNHNSGQSFDSKSYRVLASLPKIGGATAQYSISYENTPAKVPYGTIYNNIQDVVNFLSGYGKFLEKQGFVFDDYNADLTQILNWKFTVKEFLYWTTQNWADNNVITLSPFANKLKFQFNDSIVDNIFNSFYDYSLLKADGTTYPPKDFSLSRTSGFCVISTKNDQEGLFFARLRLIQKEHAIIFNNLSRFNDVIYDTQTGYRQRRVRLVGFRTAEWNGDFYSPGFVYDSAKIATWEPYTDYVSGDVVEYTGNYYSLDRSLAGQETFNFSKWNKLGTKPVAQLLPNFEYKINQFEDFYSLDIDNFDLSQQQLAQHLIGYSSRIYLDNIFLNPIAQYKFFQGFIREKGTKNALNKLARATVHNLQGKLDFTEEWAFRIGTFGAYSSLEELEFPLAEPKVVDNSQLIRFVNEKPTFEYDTTAYVTPSDISIMPTDFDVSNIFKTVKSTTANSTFIMPVAGYARLEDVDYTVKNKSDILTTITTSTIKSGDTIWVAFDDNQDWGVYRYTRVPAAITAAEEFVFGQSILFTTDKIHQLSVGDIVGISNFSEDLNRTYIVTQIDSLKTFVVASTAQIPATTNDFGVLFRFVSSRFDTFDQLTNTKFVADIKNGKKIWVDENINGQWEVYEKVNNYIPTRLPNSIKVDASRFGEVIVSREDSPVFVVSSPDYNDGNGSGRVFVYTNVDGVVKPLFNYTINSSLNQFYNNTTEVSARFGHALEFDSSTGLIFASAPFASGVRSDVSGNTRMVLTTNSTSTRSAEGMVVISAPNAANNRELRYMAIASSDPAENAQFGYSLYVGNTTTNRILLVGAPGQPNNADDNVGKVWCFNLLYDSFIPGVTTFDNGLTTFDNTVCLFDASGNSITTVAITATTQLSLPTIGLSEGSRFGETIAGNLTGSRIAVSVPGYDNNNGAVYVYNTSTSLTYGLYQILSWDNSEFRGATSVDILNSTNNGPYPTTTTISFSAPDLPSGRRATGRPVINEHNTMTGVIVTDYGLGYITPPTITVSNTPATVATFRINSLQPNLKKIPENSSFGSSIDFDDTGEWLFVSAYDADDNTLEKGKVLIYRWDGSQYKFTQLIDNPSTTSGLKFGYKIESDSKGNSLVITSQGPNNYFGYVFDNGNTVFDSETTRFGDYISEAGSAYIYNRYENNFVYSTELFDSYITPGSYYGSSVSVNRGVIYVGAPLFTTTGTIRGGEVYVWDAIDANSNSWKLLRQQEDVINPRQIKQIKTIDTFNDSVIDYLEIYDPVKGVIPTIADQEIRYKTFFDPAIYNNGTATNVTIDLKETWTTDHLGELWWDLSSIKYTWYEQGSIDYKRNSWGTLFPGCSVDIYEWVSSEFLPSEWADNADTANGLAIGQSGIPKYANNSAYVVEEVYSPSTNVYTNMYYYWVKNTIIIPQRHGRQISAYDVAGLISDPKLYGLKYAQIISTDTINIVNIKGSLVNDRIYLNLQLDDIDNENNKHTDWLLIEEGSANSVPNYLLEKKLIDSLLGRDGLGNVVPDPTLNVRQRYGIGIRPRQSMFKDRLSALRNLITYANSIFLENLITDLYSLQTLKSKDEIPSLTSREYDIIVEDLLKRDTIDYSEFVQAQLACELVDGKITSVTIVEPGFGYGTLEVSRYDNDGNPIAWHGPLVEIFNDTNGASLETEINANGAVINVIIANAGKNYSSPPTLYVRPFTVLVQTDSNSKGLWTKYNLDNNTWSKIQTQSFDTTLYWDYIDWVSPAYNPYQSIVKTIDQIYQLPEVSALANEYVKVNNNGYNRYIILKKTEEGVLGTYDVNYDLMYSEHGTIEIKESVWNTEASQLGWDQISPYDDTFFDQTPDIELQNIIYALKNDIFVGNLKIHWNKFFFAAIKYVLTEQKFIDWAFKTSFISVHNVAGSLTQRPVYKFQDTTWYEDYFNEIKPYHTKIRTYQLTYDIVEPSQTFSTDFDLPSVFDKDTGQYKSLTIADPLTQTYPYKGWADNYTLYLDSILIANSGSGYTETPEVRIISAPDDTVTRVATARAVLSGGKIINFEIDDKGQGYTKNPTIVIVGGGGPELVPATATPVMNNGKIRTNKIGLKFDRISSTREVGSKTATDTFVATGANTEFVLSWPALSDKTQITVTENGIIILGADYTLEDFTRKVNGYNKQYTRVILNYAPNVDRIVKVVYPKSLKIYTAFDRIQDYYNPNPGMPGKDIDHKYSQLMKGMEYPGTELKTQEFAYDYSWDALPFGSTVWDPISAQTQDLDTIYDGGNLSRSGGKFATANGINPTDIILDGDEFTSPWRSYAPEEVVPGQVDETLAINVFTRQSSGTGMIYTMIYPKPAGEPSNIQLTIRPPNSDSIFVTFNDSILYPDYDYSLQTESNILYIVPKSIDGVIKITYAELGGTGFLSKDSATVEGESVGAVIGSCAFADVKSVFVSVNGNRVDAKGTYFGQPNYYILSEAEPGVSNRAKITVYDLGTDLKNTIVAVFYSARYKGFSEIREQIDLTMTPNRRVIPIFQAPGTLGPASSNSIVEVNRKRIIPPNTTYYEIINTAQTTYDISTRRTFPYNSFDLTMLEVYKNGQPVPITTYHLDQYNNKLIFPANYFAIGDVLAITAIIDYDYIIRGTKLEITNRVSLEPGSGNSVLDSPGLTGLNFVRIITFTNHDAEFIRTEVYLSNSSRLYKLSRKVINDNFVWISIGGRSLTSGFDFEILSDQRTVLLDPDIPYVEGEQVIITSFTEQIVSNTIGYKMFKDVLGRNHFKRLSAAETTYLVEPLRITDTAIIVANGEVLPTADALANVPGIIFIAGERIEYLDKSGNTLSRLRRGTLGTGAKDYYAEGTWVTDQSRGQTVPFNETSVIEQFTATGVRSVFTLTNSSFRFIPGENAHDFVEVFYGGKKLEKPTAPGVVRYAHNSTLAYDSDTSVGAIVLQPDFTITTSTVSSAIVYTVNLAFTPTTSTLISVVQRLSSTWYNVTSATATTSLLNQDTNQAVFLKEREAITPDQLYYGGDTILRFDDGTALLLDSGQVIKGY